MPENQAENDAAHCPLFSAAKPSIPPTATPASAAPMPEHFVRDLERFETHFTAAGAIRTEPDGFQWIDETKVRPGTLSAYRLLMQYGYANGLLP